MPAHFWATINPHSERAAAWQAVFGSHRIPLRSPIPILASAPGVAEGLFFELALEELTQEQRTRLIACIAEKFHIAEQEVADTLDEAGCPILSDDVTITVASPQRWM